MLIDIVARTPYRQRVVELFKAAQKNRVKLYISTVTLAETLYAASRIYDAAGIAEPNTRALEYVEWLKTRTTIVGLTGDIALAAGESKKELRIALLDRAVLAAARALGATPVFCSPQKEMKHVLVWLGEMGVLFPEEAETIIQMLRELVRELNQQLSSRLGFCLVAAEAPSYHVERICYPGYCF